MNWLLRFFTWWHGATLNTLFYNWWCGELVGEDAMGNRYYRRSKGKIDPALGFERRWVIFANQMEPSVVPEGWYGWLHHLQNDYPQSASVQSTYAWQKPRLPNMTGTANAYRPPASTLNPVSFQPPKPKYEAWRPD